MKCRHCGSKDVIKSGHRIYGGNKYQNYTCKKCMRMSIEKREKKKEKSEE